MQMSDTIPYQTLLERHPDILRLIGTMSIEATNLDVALAKLLAAVLHIDHHFGSVVYLTPKSAYARLEILTSSIKEATEKDSPIQKELLSLTKRAGKLIGKRHEAMHFAWGVSKHDPSKVVASKLPFGARGNSTTITKKELECIVYDLRSLFTDVWEKAEALFADWPPYTWPEIHQMPNPHENNS